MRTIEDKESIRWLDGCTAAETVLAQAASVTSISDREGDIYEHFVRRPAHVHQIVGVAQNRMLEDGAGLGSSGQSSKHTLSDSDPRPWQQNTTAGQSSPGMYA